MNISSKQLFQDSVHDLEGVYENRECQSLIFLLMESVFQLSRFEIITDKEITNFNQVEWTIAIGKLQKQIPVQYVTQTAWFLDRPFFVTNSVLIPRNETEELVNLIIKNHSSQKEFNILDLGTGSGCIAISLKLAFPHANVYALDISEDALKVAKKNADKFQADVTFINADMRAINLELPQFDVIVSNPPYVKMEEKKTMKTNVLANEPHLALFVENDFPLEFYESIADLGNKILKSNAYLYLEINESLGNETATMLVEKGYKNIEIIKDIFDKDRMIMANL